jgi:hypothetical protein
VDEGIFTAVPSGSMKQGVPAVPEHNTAGREKDNNDRVSARDTAKVIRTEEQMSIEPADFVSSVSVAAPVRLGQKNCAAWVPDKVISFIAANRIMNRAMDKSRKSSGEYGNELLFHTYRCFWKGKGYRSIAGIFFMRAPPQKIWYCTPCVCAPLSWKNRNFAKYKSPEYFDLEQSGHFMNNCAFHDGTLC